jgi:NAD+ synthase
MTTDFDPTGMEIDPAAESHRLAELLRRDVHKRLRRRGAVVGVSGGVDSAVVLALCVRALGSERVLGLLMPERESGTDGERLAHLVAEQLNVETVVEDITPALEGFRCYARRDEAVSRAFPDFERGRDRVKIALPGNVLEHDTLNVFTLSVIDHAGREHRVRLGPGDLNQIVAASNFKQRTRMSLLYYHAELRGYAVIGTPNKDEHDQGFFVKWGDGGYDIGPIRHLYKTQVYQLAEYLGIPEEIRAARLPGGVLLPDAVRGHGRHLACHGGGDTGPAIGAGPRPRAQSSRAGLRGDLAQDRHHRSSPDRPHLLRNETVRELRSLRRQSADQSSSSQSTVVTELGNRRAVEEDRLVPFTSMVQQCSDGEPLGSVNANASFGC